MQSLKHFNECCQTTDCSLGDLVFWLQTSVQSSVKVLIGFVSF